MINSLLAICLMSILLPSSAVVYNAADSMILKNRNQMVNPQISDPLDDLLVIDEFKNNYLFGAYLSNSSLDDFDVIATLEYGYSPIGAYNYYLYVFNHSGSEVGYNFAYSGNRIEIFNESNGTYEHAPIKYVSISSDQKFIKYRLDVMNQDYTRVDGARQYGIVGIEIGSIKNSIDNTFSLHDYEVGHSWVYTGMNDELQVDYASDFDYLQLDVNVGCYQTGSSSASPTAKNNLFYAYFAVPQTFAGEEYSLYSVHADYYDFDLSDRFAVVTDKHDYNFYKNLYDEYLADGVLDSTEREDIAYYYDEENGTNNFIARYFFRRAFDSSTFASGKHFIKGSTDVVGNDDRIWPYDETHNLETGNPYFFNVDHSDDIVPFSTVDSILDLDTTELLSGQSREDVYKEIHYTSDINPKNDSTFIDWDLISYGSEHNDWENWWSRFAYGTDVSEDSVNDIPCIEKVGSDVLTNVELSNQTQYLVEPKDIPALQGYYSANSLLLKDTYMFRFDMNVYDSERLVWNLGDASTHWNLAGYFVNDYKVAVDFDIIDLTFINDYEELLQIPVVADPHNIGSDLTPPPSGYDFSWLFMLIGTILVIILIIWLIDKLSGLFSFTASANSSRQIHSLKKEVRRSNSSNIKKRYKKKR